MLDKKGDKMKIAVNNGHGLYTAGKRTPPFPGSNKVIKEWEFNHPTALKLAEILKGDGHQVLLTSDTIQDTPLATRVSKANSWGADIYISIHYNAYKGVWGTVGGTETLYCLNSTNGKRLAEIVHHEVIKVTKWNDRGIKPRSDLYELNRTLMPAIIVEVGFMDKIEEASMMLDETFQFNVAMAIAKGVNQYFNYTPRRGMPILGDKTATLLQMQQWAKNKKATNEFVQLAPLFYKIGSQAGVNPVVAYAQAAKETGYGRFGGILDSSYHNTCGLKTASGGSDNDPNAHARFKSWEEGIQAHIDHLALYAGADGYPKEDSSDPRHFFYLFGKAPTVESLGGLWAPSPTYGIEIVKLVHEIENTAVPIIRGGKNRPKFLKW
jgi:N-acetylmuramoyl-L-alanine amidase